MDDTTKAPADAPAEEAVENNPLAEINRQKAGFTELRMKATAMALKGIKSLRHLDKVSKGRGTPTLNEIAQLFAALESQIQGGIEELNLGIQVLTQAFFQSNVQSDAVLRVLREKGVVSEDEFRAAVGTIIDEQRAAVKEKESDTLEDAVDQLKG